MVALVPFIVGYVAGLVAVGLGWLAAVGGIVFSLQERPVDEWWFGVFDWVFSVFDTGPGEFAVGFLFGVSSAGGVFATHDRSTGDGRRLG